jgi:ribosomal protein S13
MKTKKNLLYVDWFSTCTSIDTNNQLQKSKRTTPVIQHKSIVFASMVVLCLLCLSFASQSVFAVDQSMNRWQVRDTAQLFNVSMKNTAEYVHLVQLNVSVATHIHKAQAVLPYIVNESARAQLEVIIENFSAIQQRVSSRLSVLLSTDLPVAYNDSVEKTVEQNFTVFRNQLVQELRELTAEFRGIVRTQVNQSQLTNVREELREIHKTQVALKKDGFELLKKQYHVGQLRGIAHAFGLSAKHAQAVENGSMTMQQAIRELKEELSVELKRNASKKMIVKDWKDSTIQRQLGIDSKQNQMRGYGHNKSQQITAIQGDSTKHNCTLNGRQKGGKCNVSND